MVVMEAINAIAEFILRVVIVVGVTGVVVWALASWMQNNPTLKARRDAQAREALKVKIASEPVKRNYY
jgi:hypothetical protein